MCCVIPPASPLATRVRRMKSRSEVLPWSTWPMTVTTGGRGRPSADEARERTAARCFFLKSSSRGLARRLVLLGPRLGRRLVQGSFGLDGWLRFGDRLRRSSFRQFRCRHDRFACLRRGFLGLLFLLGLPLL